MPSKSLSSGRSTHWAPKLRFQTLFGILVLMLVLPGTVFEGVIGRMVGAATSTLVLLAVLYGSKTDRRRLLIGTMLGIPFLLTQLIVAFRPGGVPEGAKSTVSLVFLAYVTWIVVSDLIRRDEVFGDAIFAAACAYLLIGFTFASAYVVIDQIQPGSFRLTDTRQSMTMDEAAYYSLVTLTTLGYGDIVPIATFARRVSTLEAIVGVLYLAIVVSRLVSIVRRHPTDHPG